MTNKEAISCLYADMEYLVDNNVCDGEEIRLAIDALRAKENASLKDAKDADSGSCRWNWIRQTFPDSRYAAIVECKGDRVLFDSKRLFSFCPYCGKKIVSP